MEKGKPNRPSSSHLRAWILTPFEKKPSPRACSLASTAEPVRGLNSAVFLGSEYSWWSVPPVTKYPAQRRPQPLEKLPDP